MQQVAVLDTETGEVSERQLAHDGSAVEEFYAALPGRRAQPDSILPRHGFQCGRARGDSWSVVTAH
jgi:hypothetical protein